MPLDGQRRRALTQAEDAAYSSLGPEVRDAAARDRERARNKSFHKHRDIWKDTSAAEDADEEERFRLSMELRRSFGPGRAGRARAVKKLSEEKD